MEQYQLWVNVADRAVQRKEQTNRLFITLITALFAASSFVIGSLLDRQLDKFIPLLPGIVGAAGIALGLAWFVTLQALERVIQAKLETIRKMETALPFPVYNTEINERNKIGPIFDLNLPLLD